MLIFKNGVPLSRDRFVNLLREALSRCDIDCHPYSGHSFRIGAATTAAQAGIPAHIIKAMGRWQSEAYLIYLRIPVGTLTSVAAQLAPHRHPAERSAQLSVSCLYCSSVACFLLIFCFCYCFSSLLVIITASYAGSGLSCLAFIRHGVSP